MFILYMGEYFIYDLIFINYDLLREFDLIIYL